MPPLFNGSAVRNGYKIEINNIGRTVGEDKAAARQAVNSSQSLPQVVKDKILEFLPTNAVEYSLSRGIAKVNEGAANAFDGGKRRRSTNRKKRTRRRSRRVRR